ncbi:MAG: hypothetical protein A2V66_05495 [Ignavibacteria bacterium RBG_13_36_8]|nr:MAG: hypothetical protein A2V66_05495 [Ignavibacteria bacterium RBG_13_36_8]
MLAHINIMLQVVALFAGVWIVFYIRQVYKSYGNTFLRRLIWVSVLLNLWLLISLMSKYININVTYFYSSTRIAWGYILRHPVSTIIFTGMILTFLLSAAELFGYKVSITTRNIFTGIFIVVLINYLMGFVLYVNNPASQWLDYTDIILHTAGISITYVALSYLVMFNSQEGNRKYAVKIFGIFYAIVFLPFAAFVFMIPMKLTILSGLFILSNLFPYFWLRYFFSKYYVDPLRLFSGDGLFDHIVEKYQVSKRESEIMELLLKGKSNKEIERELFISLHTVRNHIHNLYQKLGVNSRGQLINLILEKKSKI